MPLHLALDGVTTEIDAVVFDCDGVLLETIPAKLKLIWTGYQQSTRHTKHSEHNLKSFGTSRSLQLRYFWELLGQQVMTAL